MSLENSKQRYVMARKLAEKITRYSMNNGGKQILEGFEDFLQFSIYAWLSERKSWKEVHFERTQKELIELKEILTEYSNDMHILLQDNSWCDLIGYMYESFAADGGQRKAFNQFFTPEHVCTLMAESVCGKFNLETCNKLLKGSYTTLDPTSGSGRLLLAHHSYIIKTYNGIGVPYLLAEDLSRTATLMTTLNFLVHGCVGEVINHDTLTEPDTMRFGFFVNRHMYEKEHELFRLPHVEIITDYSETKFYKVLKSQREEYKNKQIENISSSKLQKILEAKENAEILQEAIEIKDEMQEDNISTSQEVLQPKKKIERIQLELF